MAKLSRRAFIGGALGAIGLFAVAPYAAYHYWYGDPRRIVIAVLQRRVGYLRNPPGSFERFADAYVQYKAEHASKLAKLSVIALPWTYFTVYRWLPMGHPVRRLEDNVVSKYLLSTDFFLHGGDESRQLQYLSFYEPERAPCRNPLAGLQTRI